jgi:hypothetical protein
LRGRAGSSAIGVIRGRSTGSRARRSGTSGSTRRSRHTSHGSYSIATMLAALWLLADAASEGKDVVLMMFGVMLVFVGVILIGDLVHSMGARRRRSKLSRPL